MFVRLNIYSSSLGKMTSLCRTLLSIWTFMKCNGITGVPIYMFNNVGLWMVYSAILVCCIERCFVVYKNENYRIYAFFNEDFYCLDMSPCEILSAHYCWSVVLYLGYISFLLQQCYDCEFLEQALYSLQSIFSSAVPPCFIFSIYSYIVQKI